MSQAEVAPAEGERRALLGYVPRSRVCARLVYEAVLQGTFDWLQLQSAEAGQVDDFIIATPGRLDAYQVKHGETATTYTLASLLRSDRSHGDASTDSLVKQLCSAWQRLTSIHSDRHVHVHLVLRGIPTKIGSIKDLPQTDRQKNFQTFLNEYWLADPPDGLTRTGLVSLRPFGRSAISTETDSANSGCIRTLTSCLTSCVAAEARIVLSKLKTTTSKSSRITC